MHGYVYITSTIHWSNWDKLYAFFGKRVPAQVLRNLCFFHQMIFRRFVYTNLKKKRVTTIKSGDE